MILLSENMLLSAQFSIQKHVLIIIDGMYHFLHDQCSG